MPEPAAPRWATVNQAATYANVSPRTVRHWITTGTLPAQRLGPRRIQIDLADIDALRQPVRRRYEWLTPADEQLAAEVAASLLPLADWQREKLSLLLNPGAGHTVPARRAGRGKARAARGAGEHDDAA